jgi:hypothetical protein
MRSAVARGGVAALAAALAVAGACHTAVVLERDLCEPEMIRSPVRRVGSKAVRATPGEVSIFDETAEKGLRSGLRDVLMDCSGLELVAACGDGTLYARCHRARAAESTESRGRAARPETARFVEEQWSRHALPLLDDVRAGGNSERRFSGRSRATGRSSHRCAPLVGPQSRSAFALRLHLGGRTWAAIVSGEREQP